MKNLIHNFIYIVIPSFVCIISFCIFGISSFGASAYLTLGSGASQSLSSGLSSIFDLSSISASPDPLGFSIGLSRIYDNLDQYLYQNYDYDLTGTLNDTLEGKNELLNSNMNISAEVADSFVSKLSGGIYSGVQQLTGAGYALYRGITNGLSQAKDTFFLGKAQDGVITETLGGALTYVDDNTLSMYESALSNAISNNSLIDYTDTKSYFNSKFQFRNGDYLYNIVYPQNVMLYCGEYNHYVYCLAPASSFDIGSFSGNRVNVTNGSIDQISNTSITSDNGYISIGDVNYLYGRLLSSVGYIESSSIFQTRSEAVAYINTYNPYHVVSSGVYSLSPGIEAILQQLLGELKGHYVSTSDLEALVDSLSNNGVITNDDVVIDGVTENVPVIDWTQDYIDTLQGIIEGILENSAVYDDVISDSNADTPDPGPDPYDNTGTRVPDGLPGIFSPIIETIQVPFSVVSMFEPIFYIFTGGLSSLFSIWILFPLFILVLLVIWALK